MLLTPPCIATMIVVKLQANSYKWMIFAILFPIFLGLILSSSVFTLGTVFHISGVNAMGYFYVSILAIALVLGFLPNKQINWTRSKK